MEIKKRAKRVKILLEESVWGDDGNYYGSSRTTETVTLMALVDGYAMVRENKNSEPFIIDAKRIIENGNA